MKKEVVILSLITAMAFLSVGIISFNFDPFRASGYIKVLFFTSLFTTIWSSGAILFFYLKQESETRFGQALTRGLLLSVVILAIFLGLRLK